MDLDRLASFLAVIDAGGITAAARRRNLTQPAVSQHVRALEEELGTPLLHRRGRGAVPTEAGEALARRAREAMRALRDAEGEIAELRGLSRGTVRLGVTDAAATGLLPRAFARFHAEHPGVDVRVSVHPTAALAELLHRGDIDLAVGTLPVPRVLPGIAVRPLVEEPLHLVVPRALARAPWRTVLVGEPFIAYPSGSVTRRLVDAALAAAHLEVRPAMEIGRPDVMIRLVEAGIGIAVLPADAVSGAGDPAAVAVLARRSFRPMRALGLLECGEPRGPAVRAFVRALQI